MKAYGGLLTRNHPTVYPPYGRNCTSTIQHAVDTTHTSTFFVRDLTPLSLLLCSVSTEK